MNPFIYDTAMNFIEITTVLRSRRKWLLTKAKGRVLEIGAGTGLNLNFYSESTELTALEPDPGNQLVLSKRAVTSKSKVEIIVGDAQSLPFEDGVFDTVVATLVFCTIDTPEQAMKEAWRVLKPNGQFLLIEHVRSTFKPLAWIQDRLTPFWRHIAGGCHLNRNPQPLLDNAGFKITEQNTFWFGLGKLWICEKLHNELPSDP